MSKKTFFSTAKRTRQVGNFSRWTQIGSGAQRPNRSSVLPPCRPSRKTSRKLQSTSLPNSLTRWKLPPLKTAPLEPDTNPIAVSFHPARALTSVCVRACARPFSHTCPSGFYACAVTGLRSLLYAAAFEWAPGPARRVRNFFPALSP